MMSLFSSFDLFYESMPYIGLFILTISLISMFYKVSSLEIIMSQFFNMFSFFYSLKPKMFSKVSISFIFSSMLTIFIFNFISVFPFNFPITSQFGVIFLISLCFWLSLISFNLTWNFKSTIIHMVTEGAPIYLILFLFLIEFVSNLIRPITLSVRLVANILAGHLLMILLSKLVLLFPFIFFTYMALNLVELFVSFIQSYIFCTMICLYFSEIH